MFTRKKVRLVNNKCQAEKAVQMTLELIFGTTLSFDSLDLTSGESFDHSCTVFATGVANLETSPHPETQFTAIVTLDRLMKTFPWSPVRLIMIVEHRKKKNCYEAQFYVSDQIRRTAAVHSIVSLVNRTWIGSEPVIVGTCWMDRRLEPVDLGTPNWEI
jgi:hypothetical protein